MLGIEATRATLRCIRRAPFSNRCVRQYSSPTPTTTKSTSSVHVGILLKRSPVILRTLTPFESAYYAYRESLELSEASSFKLEFYFKKGSTAEQRWFAAQEAADEEIKKLGVPVQPRDEELSHIELAGRETEADRSGDKKSLERMLERTVYLVVKRPSGEWEFPAGPLEEAEVLHEAATRHLHTEVGANLENWVVGRTPVGHAVSPSTKKQTFFMKSHIIAGRITPSKEKVTDHAWLTKQELSTTLEKSYYDKVKGMLAEL
ncbi:39S mitochondrial ribosomal protein L46-domain-containing protein [Phlyctochytrium arcticum]|nr:39S mitochondrial ribosomal protein L46-domain-containing protein [Phlyctochytrium arcticum]KAI9102628.1 39S mitochondrial ribosomal protein L46-domain-containing protein [Phlyctochytrium arcticum]